MKTRHELSITPVMHHLGGRGTQSPWPRNKSHHGQGQERGTARRGQPGRAPLSFQEPISVNSACEDGDRQQLARRCDCGP